MQIWQIIGWLKIQKLEYVENGAYLFYETKKFLTCASDIERSYCFAAEVIFNASAYILMIYKRSKIIV